MATKPCPEARCGAHMEATRDDRLFLTWEGEYQHLDAYQPVWACRNCRLILPRRINKRGTEATPSQLASVERFKTLFLRAHALGPEYEIKEFKTEPGAIRGTLDVTIETGRMNDANTMASIFCRTRAVVTIGRKGGWTHWFVGEEGKLIKTHNEHEILWQEVRQKEMNKAGSSSTPTE